MELIVFLVSLFGFLALGIPIAIVLVLCSMVLMYYGGMWDSMFVMTIPQSMLDEQLPADGHSFLRVRR